MPPKKNGGRSASKLKGPGSVYVSNDIKPVEKKANMMEINLEYMKPNYVQMNREVIWIATWMGHSEESMPIKVKTASEMIGESVTIDLNVKFTLPLNTQITSSYLNALINNPVLISAYDASATKSTTKATSKNAGEMLGQCCLDLLPLLTNKYQEPKTSGQLPTEAGAETKPPAKQPLENLPNPVESVVKVKDAEIRAELLLEPKEVAKGSDMLGPLNKMSILVSAVLYLENPIPAELVSTNILTLVLETAYNLPSPLSELDFDLGSLKYSLGMTLPLITVGSTQSMGSSGATEPTTEPQEEHQMILLFPAGVGANQPDRNYRAKWKIMDEKVTDSFVTGRAKYTTHRVTQHTADVKYGETVHLEADGKNHIQWNQMYRVWLTAATEQMVRQHIETFGMCPLEIQIVSSVSSADQRKKEDKKSVNKSGANVGASARLKPPSHPNLPIHQLALVDLTDLLHPGLTRSRVLATFLPNPTEEILSCKTGMDKFVFMSWYQRPSTYESTADTDFAKVSKMSVRQGNASGAQDGKEKRFEPQEDPNFPANPFSVIVHLELSRPLTNKPEPEAIILELSDVIGSKEMYVPDAKRKRTKQTSETFEKAIAEVTKIFYAEYEDYVKLKAKVEQESKMDNVEPGANVDISCTGKAGDQSVETVHHRTSALPKSHYTAQGVSEYQVIDHKPAESVYSKQDGSGKQSQPRIQLYIGADFKEFLSLSGAFTRCYAILEPPLSDYVRSNYRPDNDPAGQAIYPGAEPYSPGAVTFGAPGQAVSYATLYSVQRLADIHAHLMWVMSRVVEGIEAGSQGSRAAKEMDGKCGNKGTGPLTSLLSQDATLSKLLAYSLQYHAEGFIASADRLLLSRIHTVRSSHGHNAQVWADYGRFCLGVGRLEEARESLKQALYLSAQQETLMMLGYVSYRLKQWDKADLYLTALSHLFSSSIEVWITLHVYHLNTGRYKDAATALHIAQTCQARTEYGDANQRSDFSDEGSNWTTFDKKPPSPSDKPPSLSNNLTTLSDAELCWLDPAPYCFKDERSVNTGLLKSCPLLLKLNMFEFAESCIGEHRLKHNPSSLLAVYFTAVSHYKQGCYTTALSHLNSIPTPLSKCVPVLVLKFHSAYAVNSPRLNNTAQTDLPESQTSRTASSINESNKTHKPLAGADTMCAQDYWKPSAQKPTTQACTQSEAWNSAPRAADCVQFYASMRWEVEAYGALRPWVLTRLSRVLTREGEEGLKEAEQHLLRLVRDQATPLNWYYLGLLYLQQNNLPQAELSLNEANKLDPELGAVWASLALVNFRMKHPALFRNCLIKAKKYEADPILLERLDKLVPFVL